MSTELIAHMGHDLTTMPVVKFSGANLGSLAIGHDDPVKGFQ